MDKGKKKRSVIRPSAKKKSNKKMTQLEERDIFASQMMDSLDSIFRNSKPLDFLAHAIRVSRDEIDSTRPVDHTAFLQALRLLIDSTYDKIPVPIFLTVQKSMIIRFLQEPMYQEILKDIKKLGGRDSFTVSSVEDMTAIVRSAEEYLGELICRKSPDHRQNMPSTEDFIHAGQVYFALLALSQITFAQIKLNTDESDSTIWRNLFLIGLFGGEALNPLKYHSKFLKKALSREKASESRSKGWALKYILEEEARKQAEDLLAQGGDEFKDHIDLAEYIYNLQKESYPEIRGSVDFTREDFVRSGLSVGQLCTVIKKYVDTSKMNLKSPANTVEWLNEILNVPSFYEDSKDAISVDELTPSIRKLVRATNEARKVKRLLQLDEKEKKQVKKLNRYLIALIDPSLVPKAPEKDYSRSYTVNVVKKAIDQIVIREGLKTGISTGRNKH